MDFNVDSQLRKLELSDTTFSSVDIDSFHNTRAKTVFSFLYEWILMVLSVVLLGTDIYTCLNILVFHHWSSEEYQPYEYNTAKWIFTGCIIFQFALLAYRFGWGIYMYRTRNIAFAYLNGIARCFYTLRSYNYHCFFSLIEQDNFFDWACFFTYYELDSALQILVADTPRQVINVLTLRYYATGGDRDNDILANIKWIATKNLKLAVILGMIVVSVVIWSFFCFKFLLGMLFFPFVITKVRRRGFSTLKKYNCSVLNKRIKKIVLRNHTKLQQKAQDALYFGKKGKTLVSSYTVSSDLTEKAKSTFSFRDVDPKPMPKPMPKPDASRLPKQPSLSSLTYPAGSPFSDANRINPFEDIEMARFKPKMYSSSEHSKSSLEPLMNQPENKENLKEGPRNPGFAKSNPYREGACKDPFDSSYDPINDIGSISVPQRSYTNREANEGPKENNIPNREITPSIQSYGNTSYRAAPTVDYAPPNSDYPTRDYPNSDYPSRDYPNRDYPIRDASIDQNVYPMEQQAQGPMERKPGRRKPETDSGSDESTPYPVRGLSMYGI